MSERVVESAQFPTVYVHNQTGSPRGREVVLPASHTTTYYGNLLIP